MSTKICHNRHVWLVEFESLAVQNEVEDLIRLKKLTDEDHAIIRAWIQQITLHGPESVRGDFKWADHALSGEWARYRSSAFSNRGRIIYRIFEKNVLIKIARITDKHDYKKGRRK